MPSTITITLDAQGNVTIGQLPPGVFHSNFATPPDAQIRDVIAINAANLYTVVVNAPMVTGASSDQPDGPLTVVGWTETQATFALDAGELPIDQTFGMATCQLGSGASFELGVLVNPAALSLPMGIDAPNTMTVNQDAVPVGVHCDLARQKIAVWAAGGYTFAFSLPTEGDLRFDHVELTPLTPMMMTSISGDRLTAWIFNNNMAVHPGLSVDVKFHCVSLTANADVVLDPTIINNPINQGGGDGLPGGAPLPRLELSDALVH